MGARRLYAASTLLVWSVAQAPRQTSADGLGCGFSGYSTFDFSLVAQSVADFHITGLCTTDKSNGRRVDHVAGSVKRLEFLA